MTNTEFKPHDAVDLTNQDTVFLVLEELGIAHMQHVWLKTNAPEHEDAKAVEAQAEEFFEDLCAILAGRADPSRVVANGWAGASLAAHLRRALKKEIEAKRALWANGRTVDAIDDDTTIVLALRCYLECVEKLTALDAAEKAAGRKLPAEDYIQVMAGWSGVFSGKHETLEIPDAYRV